MLFLVRLEIVVDPWIEGVWQAIKKSIAEMATLRQQDTDSARSLQTTDLTAATNQENTQPSGLDVGVASLTLKDMPAQASEVPKSIPEIGTEKTEAVVLEASLAQSLPPLSESALNVPALPPPFLSVSLEEPPAQEVGSLSVLLESVLDIQYSHSASGKL